MFSRLLKTRVCFVSFQINDFFSLKLGQGMVSYNQIIDVEENNVQ